MLGFVAGFGPPGPSVPSSGVNVAVDSYEERACVRCLKGFVYDGERGAWVECEAGMGTGRAMVYVYPKPKRRLH